MLVTDISRDGMMRGPNLSLMREIASRLPHVRLQASGGVAGIADLAALAGTGADGAIVGRALWEGRVDLAEALSLARA
jgi:phosphoribosylformimino-5-aminoimidazole carboxamide ribotide isomerase